MSRMAICVATMRPRRPELETNLIKVDMYIPDPGPGDIPLAAVNATTNPQVHVRYNTPTDNLGVVGSYQKLYELSSEEILCYLHDDVIVREKGWDERVLREFDDPQVGLVGFGGAKWHGVNELYKTPYVLQQLRRGDYLSNVDDAEVHGERFTGSCEVAVLDGYCLVARRSFLDRISGWNYCLDLGIDFINYDYVLCALARRHGYKIRVVGVRCHHRGGGTSVALNANRQEEYDRAHWIFYDKFRDVLPARVK